MISNVLNRIRKNMTPPANDLDGKIDLKNNVIILDQTEPEKKISTRAVLKKSSVLKGEKVFEKTAGKIYIFDLEPFFNALNAKPKSRMRRSFVEFCNNRLTHSIGSDGKFTRHENRLYFFQLNVQGDAGWHQAIEIIDDIGLHYMRDAYKPDIFHAKVLSAIDPGDAINPNGAFEVEKALNSPSRQESYSAVPTPEKKWVHMERNAQTKNAQWVYAESSSRRVGVRAKGRPEKRLETPITKTDMSVW